VLLEVDERKVASVVLNRPAVNNAYDGDFIQCMLAAIDALAKVAGLRVVVVKSRGKHFQAGADLNWLNAVRMSSPEENIRASRATAEALQRLNLAPVPTVALVQGACFGGGTGILAAKAKDVVEPKEENRLGGSCQLLCLRFFLRDP